MIKEDSCPASTAEVDEYFNSIEEIKIRVDKKVLKKLEEIAELSMVSVSDIIVSEIYWFMNSVDKYWYNDPKNYPAMLIRDTEERLGYKWVNNKEEFIKHHRKGFRLITRPERDALFCEKDWR